MGAASIVALPRGVILNVLLTNVNVHAKNYSIPLSRREARLPPLYDPMCGAAWPSITQNMSQSIGGQAWGSHLYAKHWRCMAESCGLSAPAVQREVVALAGWVVGKVAHVVDEVRGMPAEDHPSASAALAQAPGQAGGQPQPAPPRGAGQEHPRARHGQSQHDRPAIAGTRPVPASGLAATRGAKPLARRLSTTSAGKPRRPCLMLRNILHRKLRKKAWRSPVREVSSAEVQRNFGTYRELAEGNSGAPEPVTVLHYNKPSVVIVSADEYARLKRRDKQVLAAEDLPRVLVDLIAATEMDARFAHLDDGLDLSEVR